MREIISLQIGQCGNNVGIAFWKIMCEEQGVSEDGTYIGGYDDQLEKIGTYFEEHNAKYYPHSILIDTTPDAINSAQYSPFGKLLKPNNCIFGTTDINRNWAKGKYTDCADLLSASMDSIRKEVEKCDLPQGFQMTHSSGGGCGAGFGSSLLESIKDCYAKTILHTFTILPSVVNNSSPMEIYNTVLSLRQLTELTHMTNIFDNDALKNLCICNGIRFPSIMELNFQLLNAMSSTTCMLRFSSSISYTLHKLACNMVPFPRMHFLAVGIAAIIQGTSSFRQYTMSELNQTLYGPKCMTCGIDPSVHKHITLLNIYRGRDHYSSEVYNYLSLNNTNKSLMLPWIPDNFMRVGISIPPRGVWHTSAIITNTTSIASLLLKLKIEFNINYKKRCGIQHYMNEGMDMAEFEDAAWELDSLIYEYQNCEYIGNEDDSDV